MVRGDDMEERGNAVIGLDTGEFFTVNIENPVTFPYRMNTGQTIYITLQKAEGLVWLFVEGVVTKAYKELMSDLFGHVPERPEFCSVDKDKYQKVLEKIQDRYGLDDDHPEYEDWIMTLLHRKPKLIQEGDTEDAATTE